MQIGELTDFAVLLLRKFYKKFMTRFLMLAVWRQHFHYFMTFLLVNVSIKPSNNNENLDPISLLEYKMLVLY